MDTEQQLGWVNKDDLPTITMVIPAYNEEQWIAEKIRNVAMLDYPKNKLTVDIVCDGCTDNTAKIAQQTIQEATCAATFFRVHVFDTNVGKVPVINRTVQSVSSELTVLSDVSAIVSIDALMIAQQHFNNPNVGVVNGRYTLFDKGTEGEAHYWKYQSDIKYAESKIATTIGAHGAFYVFRSNLFTPLPDNTINDDFVIPMQIVSQGYDSVYDNNVIATELEPTNIQDDFSRRLRISAGNMQQVLLLANLFHPRFHRVAFAFFSGKGLRLLTPYLMVVALISSIQMVHIPLFQLMLGAQLFLYAIGVCSFIIPQLKSSRVMQLVHYLLLGHIANLIGGLGYLLTSRKSS
jgi:cellulose synthase/poly-beta-1,6-N-acetylglucosamine synthase-like glycosyltransferase